ncbi:MAG: ABC transporter permease [Chloroflexi bacterium]|nr:MAG: ABC transporter permease [Chloroflexota bacterium]
MFSNTIKKHTNSNELFDTHTTSGNIWHNIREIYRYRFLLQNLVIRDLKVRYKNSILGVLWSLLNPLLMMTVYTILFTVLIPNNNIRNYPVFILVALIPWNFLSSSLTSGTLSITGNAPLIKKVYFPRILLPTATLLSNLVNFLLAFLILIFLLFFSGIGLTVHALWVPVILLTQMIFIHGLCLILSTLNAFYRDVAMMLNVVLLAWFFLTPVFYPFERLGESAVLFGIHFNPAIVMRWLNPMASIIDSYRTVLWGTVASTGPVSMDPKFLLRTFVTSLLIFIIGYIIFTRSEHLFGEKL